VPEKKRKDDTSAQSGLCESAFDGYISKLFQHANNSDYCPHRDASRNSLAGLRGKSVSAVNNSS
jgi:hypothetical protein